MKILAIETSSEQGSLALLRNGDCALVSLDPGPAQSATALAKLDAVLAAAALRLADLDAIAFGCGPGMFTGLRFGCGLAQGLALGAGRPLIAVSSQQALALQSPGERILVATDARMGEVYWRCYRRSSEGLAPIGPAACTPPEQVALGPGEAWHGIGNAFSLHAERLPATLRGRLAAVDGTAVASARELARLAVARCAAGEFTALGEAIPEYVRDKVALTTAERQERGGRR